MSLLDRIKSAYISANPKHMNLEDKQVDIQNKKVISIFLCAASLLLTVLNIFNHYWFMMWTTAFLAVCFFTCAVLCRNPKNRGVVVTIMGICIGTIFSVYALIGGNEGFAIIWIMLVPPIGMTMIGLRAGTALSAYFQVFLMILFYSPLRDTVEMYYTGTFMIRFPILYMVGFAVTVLLKSQQEFFEEKTERMAYLDSMTGLYNRRRYAEKMEELENEPDISELTLITVDINMLKYTNDNFGHNAGDELVNGTADCLREAFKTAECICRIGGDEFSVITKSDEETVKREIETLRNLYQNWRGKLISKLSLSIGAASKREYTELSLAELEKEADKRMYNEKSLFYKSSGFDRRR